MRDNKATILIVDDTETNIDILLDLLSDYDVAVAMDGSSALEIASEDTPDLILLDIMMPGMNGYEVCKRLKSKKETESIPVVFITAKTDEDSIEEAYDVGGIDYVVKPFKPRELLARVKTQLKLKSLMEGLEFMASYDQMTGVYNRRKFFELATQKFNTPYDHIYGIMIDIDNFKNINDSYGHPTGDKVIKLVAQIISKHVSDDNILGRIGGEEFAIICSSDSQENLLKNIELIRDSVSKLEVTADNGEIIKCTISNGISKTSKDINSVDLLLKEADIALYKAKNAGRNRVIFR